MTTHPQFGKPDALYGYTPATSTCATFIALFGLLGLLHIAQAVYHRTWWLFPTVVAASVDEVIGWIGRLWSSKNVGFLTPFLMQTTTIVISPTPLVAANFVILGKLIRLVGNEYRRLGPNTYTALFCMIDVIALVIQAIGGSTASRAVENNLNPEKGAHIMLGGIVFQLASIILYTALALEFLTRVVFHRPVRRDVPSPAPDLESKLPPVGVTSPEGGNEGVSAMPNQEVSRRNIRLISYGLAFSTLCILIRSIYRTIELHNGFSGSIIHDQQLFNWLDGAMIVPAISTWNLLHPGRLLPNCAGW